MLPIEMLVESRLASLGLRRSELVQRLGFKHTAKGLRRLRMLYEGEVRRTAFLRQRLGPALELEQEQINEAVGATERAIAARQQEKRDREEAEWRAAFRAHAILIPENATPSPLFAMILLGGPEKLLRVELDTTRPPVTFVDQVLSAMRVAVPTFGSVIGFVVNYSPDQAIRFNLQGSPVHRLSEAVRPGEAALYVSGRDEPLMRR